MGLVLNKINILVFFVFQVFLPVFTCISCILHLDKILLSGTILRYTRNLSTLFYDIPKWKHPNLSFPRHTNIVFQACKMQINRPI